MCGLDPRHPALQGTEMRACWSAAAPPDEPDVPGTRVAAGTPDGLWGMGDGRRPRTFVPVETLTRAVPAGAATAVLEAVAEATTPEPGFEAQAVGAPVPAPAQAKPVPGRWWLWGDPDPWPEP